MHRTKTGDLLAIRKIEFGDLETVYCLLQEVSKYHPCTSMHQDIYAKFNSQLNGMAICAEVENKVIGFGSIFYITRVRGGRVGIIEDVIVSKEFRGQGIGNLIIETLIDDAVKNSTSKVTLEASELAKPFYSIHGFEKAGNLMKKFL